MHSRLPVLRGPEQALSPAGLQASTLRGEGLVRLRGFGHRQVRDSIWLGVKPRTRLQTQKQHELSMFLGFLLVFPDALDSVCETDRQNLGTYLHYSNDSESSDQPCRLPVLWRLALFGAFFFHTLASSELFQSKHNGGRGRLNKKRALE